MDGLVNALFSGRLTLEIVRRKSEATGKEVIGKCSVNVGQVRAEQQKSSTPLEHKFPSFTS
jgi:hypothetical protein